MRLIVIGTKSNQQPGVQQLNVWFRFPASGARQTYYGKVNAAFTPSAPGDYANADQAEIAAFQNGSYVERAGFVDIIDPTSNIATIEARLQNIYAAANTAWNSADTVTLANWQSSWDGTTWTLKSS